MTQEQLRLLRRLCETCAPAGREGAMSALMAEEFRRYASPVHRDWLGNVSATFGSGEPSLLIFAHMDEIGFVVRNITPEGFLRVERLGGVSRRAALGTPVVVLGRDGHLNGTMGLPSHHLTPPEEQFTIPSVEAWYMDIGADAAETARSMGAEVGSFATFAPNFRELGGGKAMSKSLDNRICCWVLLELARHFAENPPKAAVHLLANVQEEFHLRGLLPAVKRLLPTLALGLDITPAADTPDLVGRNSVRLGGGPAVKVMDFHGRGSLNGLLTPPFLIDWLENAAHRHSIPTQREVVVGVVTDGTFLPDLDIPTAALGIPARYTHSPTEVVTLEDAVRTVEVCRRCVEEILPVRHLPFAKA